MNKILLPLMIVVLISGVFIFLGSQSFKNEVVTESKVVVQETGEDEVPKKTTVEIKDFKFSPSRLTIKAGETVTVTNRDEVDHTATSDDKGLFDTGLISKDQMQTFTAPTTPGIYNYHCTPHPDMKALLIVTQ